MRGLMPEISFISDSSAAAAWESYIASGLPDHIGSFHLCLALNALNKTQLGARLRTRGGVDAQSLTDDYDAYLVKHLIRYLTIRGVARVDGDRIQLTDSGQRLLSGVAVAQLEFYINAYSPVTTKLAELLAREAIYPGDVQRDGTALGHACDDLFTTFHSPIIANLVRELSVTRIVDLGCGGGRLLMDACTAFPGLEGFGIDISNGAVSLARRQAAERGLSDRLHFAEADAFNLNTWPEEALEAELFTAVGAVHEHFRNGERAVIDILNTYATLLRRNNAKAFVLGEPELYYDDAENDADLHLVHIFTAQGFPRRREDWLTLIERSDLRCTKVVTRERIGPRFAFYILTV